MQVPQNTDLGGTNYHTHTKNCLLVESLSDDIGSVQDGMAVDL